MQQVEPGATLDRYVVETVLGQGGMAIVYRVRHAQLGTHHALKVLTIGSPSIRQRLLQEGRVQATLRHPNIVAVTDVIDLGGSPGLVMEYIKGPSLEALLANTRLTLDQADTLGQAVIAGVAAAHEAGLVHRDLKPANILCALTRSGVVPKVADFGLAKIVDDGGGSGRTRTGTTMGTPAYMSPEQIRDAKNVDVRTDIFALGAILYELVAGRQAFDGKDILDIFKAIDEGRYTPPRELVPELPERMERAILGALARERDQRIPSCDALLATWLGTETAIAAEATPIAGGNAFNSVFLEHAASLGSQPETEAQKTGPTLGATWGGSVALPSAADSRPPPATIDVSFFREDAPAAEPSMVSTLASKSPSQPPEPRGGMAGLLALGGGAVAMIGVGAVFLVIAVGITASVLMTRFGGPPGAAPSGEASVVAPAAPASAPPPPAEAAGTGDAPDEALPVADDTPVAVPPPEPDEPTKATSIPAPAPVKASTPSKPPKPSAEPAPEAASPPDAGGSATPAPSGAGTADPSPPPAAPEPPAPAAASGPSPGHALVRLEGDAKSIYLQSAAGNFKPGEVPAGSYTVTAFFDGLDPKQVMTVDLADGATVTIRCTRALVKCTKK